MKYCPAKYYSRLGPEKALTVEFDVPILRPRRRPLYLNRELVAPEIANHDIGEIALTEPRAMPEFSRPVQVDAIDADGTAIVLRADADECAALAGRLGILAVTNLLAKVSLRRTAVGLVRLNVDFSANVVQSCVVSLEAVAGRVADRFSILCEGGQSGQKQGGKRGAKGNGAEGEVYVDPFGDDPVEPLDEGRLDVGELVVQHLSLSLDPYPRTLGIDGQALIAEAGLEQAGTVETDGVQEPGQQSGDPRGEQQGARRGRPDGVGGDDGLERENPFAALKQWRHGEQG